MPTLQLCLSADFEALCNDRCEQSGSFALITTTMPSATTNRLNDGWYHHNGPRKGTQSPPLAYAQDWCVTHQWSVVGSKAWITNTPEFKNVFDRPCVIAQIEDRLIKDDNALFPGLRARDLCKNGT